MKWYQGDLIYHLQMEHGVELDSRASMRELLAMHVRQHGHEPVTGDEAIGSYATLHRITRDLRRQQPHDFLGTI